jgi:acyl-CoA thioesterase-1
MMGIHNVTIKRLCLHGLLGLAGLLSACDSGGSGGGDGYKNFDFGDNDRTKVVAIGDSITSGNVCEDEGENYPSRIAGITGLTVINAGRSGESTGGTASRTTSTLQRSKPGFLLILTGHNDAIFDRDYDSVIGNIRSIVQQAKGNKTIPILATLVPIGAPRVFATGPASDYNVGIRQLAKEEGVKLVDLEREFGSSGDLQCDGLHPNDRGSAVIANAFADRLP